MSSQIVAITDGQASATVPGPLHDGDTALFKVAVPPPPPPAKYDVDYSPLTLTWRGLKAEMAANKGKRLGLGASRPGGWTIASIFEPDPDATFDLVQLAPIRTVIDASPGAFYLRRPHGRWEMTAGIIGPITLAQISGKPNVNNSEQHHGIRQDGGDIAWIDPIISGFHGDAIAQRLWAKTNGGDDVPPLVSITGGTLSVAQRCGIGVIVCRDGSLISDVTFADIGTWPIDGETNNVADRFGSLTIRGCRFGRHNIAGNQSWGSGGIVAAVQLAGPSVKGPVTIADCSGDQFDIVAKTVNDLTLTNLTSVHPAHLLASSVGSIHRSGLVNIS